MYQIAVHWQSGVIPSGEAALKLPVKVRCHSHSLECSRRSVLRPDGATEISRWQAKRSHRLTMPIRTTFLAPAGATEICRDHSRLLLRCDSPAPLPGRDVTSASTHRWLRFACHRLIWSAEQAHLVPGSTGFCGKVLFEPSSCGGSCCRNPVLRIFGRLNASFSSRP